VNKAHTICYQVEDWARYGRLNETETLRIRPDPGFHLAILSGEWPRSQSPTFLTSVITRLDSIHKYKVSPIAFPEGVPHGRVAY
jgi:hypothetical protein